MPEVICNTSPLQYLHQLGQLDLLLQLAGTLIVAQAVVDELEQGRRLGVDVPDPESLAWIHVRQPVSAAVLPLVTDLGPGETAVLALALERENAVMILEDGLARRHARRLAIALTGALGILLDAKEAGYVATITPLLDELQRLRFRLDPKTRLAVLKRAGETNA